MAEAAARRGALVTLVTSSARPVAADVQGRVARIDVESAADMERAAMHAACPGADVVVMAAAVADFRPKVVADTEALQGGRTPRTGARADPRHPGRPGGAPRPGPGAGRIRGRDQ